MLAGIYGLIGRPEFDLCCSATGEGGLLTVNCRLVVVVAGIFGLIGRLDLPCAFQRPEDGSANR